MIDMTTVTQDYERFVEYALAASQFQTADQVSDNNGMDD